MLCCSVESAATPHCSPLPPLSRYPSLHRPYRIPLPTWACACMLGPACLLLAGLVVVPWVMVS